MCSWFSVNLAGILTIANTLYNLKIGEPKFTVLKTKLGRITLITKLIFSGEIMLQKDGFILLIKASFCLAKNSVESFKTTLVVEGGRGTKSVSLSV